MVKLKIKVTKEILEKSAFCGYEGPIDEDTMGTNCAIALAVRDIFPQAWVAPHIICPFGIKGLTHRDDIILPQEAQNFIDVFDGYTPELRIQMSELEFEVEIPDTVIEQINISEVTSLLQNHPTLKLQEA